MTLNRNIYLILLGSALCIDLFAFLSGTWSIYTVILTLLVLPGFITTLKSKEKQIKIW